MRAHKRGNPKKQDPKSGLNKGLRKSAGMALVGSDLDLEEEIMKIGGIATRVRRSRPWRARERPVPPPPKLQRKCAKEEQRRHHRQCLAKARSYLAT